jgi:hypothetical protein
MHAKHADGIADVPAEAPAAHPLRRNPPLALPAADMNLARHVRRTKRQTPRPSAETLSAAIEDVHLKRGDA